MKTKLTLALVALITSSAFAAIPAVLPEFKNEKQLAEWREAMAAKAESSPTTLDVRCSTSDVPSAFYTGKPYIETTGSYAFKYRSYNPELARWTSEDPSGFPDGANNILYVNNSVNRSVDPRGKDIYTITNPNAAMGGGHAAMIIGSGALFAYRSYGPNGIDARSFTSLSAAMVFANSMGYTDYNRWDTDPTQDAAARVAINNYDPTGTSYHLTLHNCQDAVNSGLSAAGVSHDQGNVPNQSNIRNRDEADSFGKVTSLE